MSFINLNIISSQWDSKTLTVLRLFLLVNMTGTYEGQEIKKVVCNVKQMISNLPSGSNQQFQIPGTKRFHYWFSYTI